MSDPSSLAIERVQGEIRDLLAEFNASSTSLSRREAILSRLLLLQRVLLELRGGETGG